MIMWALILLSKGSYCEELKFCPWCIMVRDRSSRLLSVCSFCSVGNLSFLYKKKNAINETWQLKYDWFYSWPHHHGYSSSFVCLFVCLFFSSSVYLGELEEVAIIFEVSIVRGTLLCSWRFLYFPFLELKSVSTRAPGSRATCHLTDFNETLSV